MIDIPVHRHCVFLYLTLTLPRDGEKKEAVTRA